jgi:cold shock CspA family protein
MGLFSIFWLGAITPPALRLGSVAGRDVARGQSSPPSPDGVRRGSLHSLREKKQAGFVHISAVERAGLSSLHEGAKVSYDIVSDRGKESAGNLRVG